MITMVRSVRFVGKGLAVLRLGGRREASLPAMSLSLHHLRFGGVGLIRLPEAFARNRIGEVGLLDEVLRIVVGIAVAIAVA